jgi:hypothetical protein
MSRPVSFSTDDLRSPESLERVLRQFEIAIRTIVPPTPQPTVAQTAAQLAPFVHQQILSAMATPIVPTSSTAVFTEDTHANRLTLYSAPVTQGTVFFETDRTVTYIGILSSGSLVWRYYSGTYYDLLANIPVDLGVNDANFRFVASDTDKQIEYMWTGTEFVTIDFLQEVIDAVTNALTIVVNWRHRSSGTPAASFGASLVTQLDSSTNVIRNAAIIDVAWTTATNASESADWILRLLSAGTATEILRASGSNGNIKIGVSTALLQFGGTSSSFAALKQASAILQARLADDSKFAEFNAGTIRSYDTGGTKQVEIFHDGTNANVLGTSGAALFGNVADSDVYLVNNNNARWQMQGSAGTYRIFPLQSGSDLGIASTNEIHAVFVVDDAYGAGWNGSTAVPTKNAVYDKMETKADAQTPGGPHTITLAKITAGGSNGSLTFNAQGVITGFVDPT